MQNALILMRSQATPYIIDPSTQAAEWLKNNLAKSNAKLEVVTQQDPRFNNTLELAVRFGKTLVIQEADQIEPIIYPLIRRDLSRQGPRWVVQLGEKTIDYNEEFKLYLVTRNPTPDIMPDAASLICEVNFTVTRSGLEGQLLGVTLQHEKPELETKKKQLLLEEEEQKMQLADLEKSLLTELASSEGNILQNKQLLLSLNETKSKSLIIAKSLSESSEIQRSLDQERDAYRPIASSGSSLYFLISDLQKVNYMYQFSLSSFVPLFKKALGTQPESGAAPKSRVQHISNTMQKLLYDFVSRSLFKADRLMFGMHLVHIMNPALFQPQEWELYIGRIVAGLETKDNATDFPAWANADRKAQFSVLQATLPSLVQGLTLRDETWAAWSKNPKCETDFPQKLTSRTSAFQKVLLVQALRPDRLESAMVQFVSEGLGVKSLTGTSLNLPRLLKEETTPTTPVLLVTTPGADPSQELEEFAEKTIGKANYRQVAMGQGQAELALSTLREGAKTGLWVTLKNLHLATSWLPILEKEMLSLSQSGGVHENFRLWLTTEPHQKFSPILLHGSLKITYEAPPGIKKNLMRTYDSWGPEYLNGSVMRAQSLFVLAWFHAIIQERRRYIPQAWTKFYEFSFADLRAASDVIENIAQVNSKQQNASPDWQTIQGLLENAIYGGRVDNEFDIRILRAYLLQYFNSDQLNQKTARKLARNVTIPSTSKFEDYLEVINNLPDSETPETFGLPANIERSVQRANSSSVISQLKVLEVTVSEGTRFNREQWATQLSPLVQLWQKLSMGNDILKAEQSGKPTSESPIDLFIAMESENVRKLVYKVNTSLNSVTKVISGSLLLSPSIQVLGTQLLRGEVPSEWSDTWEGPANPFTWLRQLVSRTVALSSWKQLAESGKILSSTLNLSDLFRPDTFLNALRQQTARASKKPIDSLRLVATWDSNYVNSLKSIHVSVEGLLLQGCNFDGDKISDAYADAPEIMQVPKCTFAWISQEDRDPYPEEASVLVPLYSSTTREKLVSQLLLPCAVGEKLKWIVAGVALFLSEN